MNSLKRRWLLFFVSSLISAVPVLAAGRGGQELVKAGSWLYDAVTALALECGQVNFADQAPLSIAELKLYVSEIDYSRLSIAGKAQYKRIIAYFDEQNISLDSDIVSLGIDPEINIEGYYKSNDDIAWVYDRYERRPLLSTPFTLGVSDYVTLSTDIKLGENKGQMAHNDNYSNVPIAPDEIDINFPDTGYLSTGYKFTDTTGVNFQLGMGAQDVGRSLSGSVITSRYMTGASYANFEIFNPAIRYTMNVTQFNVDKYMYSHRLDMRFFKKLSFSVQESMLVYHPLELRFLNPLTIYHGMSPWRDYGEDESNTCAYLALKASFALTDCVRLYGMYAMNQFQTAYEQSNWPDDTTPNSIGAQLGIESYIPFKEGYFHLWLEGYYATPYLYIKENPAWSLVRTYAENIGDMAVFYEWVGSPFGPDTMSGELNLGYEVPGRWSLNASYLLMARGEYSGTSVFSATDWGGTKTDESDITTGDWVYPSSDIYPDGQGKEEAKRRQKLSTPSGTAEYVNRIALRGSYSPFDYLTLTVQPAYVFIFNRDHVKGKSDQGVEFTVAASLRLARMFKP